MCHSYMHVYVGARSRTHASLSHMPPSLTCLPLTHASLSRGQFCPPILVHAETTLCLTLHPLHTDTDTDTDTGTDTDTQTHRHTVLEYRVLYLSHLPVVASQWRCRPSVPRPSPICHSYFHLFFIHLCCKHF